MQSPTKVRAAVIGMAMSIFLLLQLLAQYPSFVEEYYSNGLYPILTLFIAGITNQFPFSVSEVTLWLCLLVGAPFLIRRAIQKRMPISRILLNLTATISIIVVWFYISWGINYMRMPLMSTLKLDRIPLEVNAFDSTCVEVIRSANVLNPSYAMRELDEINELVEASYTEVLGDLDLKKVPGPKTVKRFGANWLFNKTTTSGWFSPFFHEVHYNSDLLTIETPFVIAHEKAHQMGYTSEAECNFLAYLVCLNSSDPLVQYSGYFSVLGYFLGSLRDNLEKRKQYVDLISDGVKLDLAAVQERWRSHVGFFSRLSDRSYDLYLKANKVKEGKLNYSRVVDLIIKYRGKLALQQEVGITQEEAGL